MLNSADQDQAKIDLDLLSEMVGLFAKARLS